MGVNFVRKDRLIIFLQDLPEEFETKKLSTIIISMSTSVNTVNTKGRSLAYTTNRVSFKG